MEKQIKSLRKYLGRVVKDIKKKARQALSQDVSLEDMLEKAKQLLSQTKASKNNLYSLHAPEVECIFRDKAHKCYKFGVKVLE